MAYFPVLVGSLILVLAAAHWALRKKKNKEE